MNASIIQKIEQEQLRSDIPSFRIGDTLKVYVRIKEGDKERTQLFTGTLIARDGQGLTETITLRRISYSVGVERVFPLHAPVVEKIEVERQGKVRAAKLYYLRGRSGKAARLKERRD